MNKVKKTIFLIIILFLSLTFMNGCASTVIKSYPPQKVRVPAPYKQVPAKNKVPPTQKPYEVMGKKYYPIPSSYGFSQKGTASWYGKKFHGKKTSNGETYDMYGPTAAHKTLPMNTFLLVENLENGKETVVRVNDRGPFVKGRIIDLSLTAAKEIDMDKKGTAKVKITAMGEAVSSVRGGQKTERFLPYEDFEKGEFYVQVGAFQSRENAERLKSELLSQGKKTVIQTSNFNDTPHHQVQVRAGTNLHDAQKTEIDLEGRFPGAFVIAR